MKALFFKFVGAQDSLVRSVWKNLYSSKKDESLFIRICTIILGYPIVRLSARCKMLLSRLFTFSIAYMRLRGWPGWACMDLQADRLLRKIPNCWFVSQPLSSRKWSASPYLPSGLSFALFSPEDISVEKPAVERSAIPGEVEWAWADQSSDSNIPLTEIERRWSGSSRRRFNDVSFQSRYWIAVHFFEEVACPWSSADESSLKDWGPSGSWAGEASLEDPSCWQ